MFRNAAEALRGANVWAEILDILLVSYLFYRLLLLARGTRALQILGGLGTLLIALILSDRFQLTTLNWLLRQILPLGPVAIVILLYPELRHALEELGPRFWSRGLGLITREDVGEMLSAVAPAIGSLAMRRVGALIVFERQTGLDEIIASGVPLNSDVTPALLETIFQKGSPLHDGAVVIRHGKIAAAACILPLTDRPRVDGSLGTRHKSALGMSENSDAVVVIVSEETGTISMAVDGKLVRRLTPETLRENLNRLLQPIDFSATRTSVRSLRTQSQERRRERERETAAGPRE